IAARAESSDISCSSSRRRLMMFMRFESNGAAYDAQKRLRTSRVIALARRRGQKKAGQEECGRLTRFRFEIVALEFPLGCLLLEDFPLFLTGRRSVGVARQAILA